MSLSELETCKVIPVVTSLDADSTVQLARTLLAGGMRTIEITLRSDSALDSISAVKAEVPGMLVAAGTVTNPADLDLALASGADLVLSPGCSEALLRAAIQAKVQYIPGVCTASEIMLCQEHGFQILKLFPAVAAGGTGLLKAFSGPFPEVRFCPTGGLNQGNFREYLVLANVMCCGGSWMVSGDLVAAGRWDEIESLARNAMS